MNWREFKPTFFFLGKFIGIYLISNIIYGIYVTSYEPKADWITQVVTEQAAQVITLLGWDSNTYNHISTATISIVYNQRAIVSVYEGCNGVNVFIIFAAFVLSFGSITKKTAYFIVSGLILIHIFNLIRIVLLFYVSLQNSHYLYFAHKYLFTAFIYAIVLLLWLVWVRIISETKNYERQ